MSDAARTIVVGIDGSENSDAATRWAVDEGARTGTPVELVYAYDWPVATGVGGLAPTVWPDYGAQEEADNIVAAAREKLRQSHPDVVTAGTVVPGAAADVLVERSQRARLVVVGGRGAGGFAGKLLGSTSLTVTARAHCPVVVVRGRKAPADAPVVAGVDGSDLSQLAVEFAFAEAASRGTSLRVVRASEPSRDADPQPRVDVEQAATAELVAGWRDKYPQVATSVHIVDGPPGDALVKASDGALLIAVGSRGRGGFRGMLLGSVSQHLLHHAQCPVVVVRDLPA
jgi:nucleotide-binding universal stress UspA family protein